MIESVKLISEHRWIAHIIAVHFLIGSVELQRVFLELPHPFKSMTKL
jgi:hypothetical protein